MTSCQIRLAATHVFWSYFSNCLSFVFLKQEILKVTVLKKILHKIQHKSIQVVAEGNQSVKLICPRLRDCFIIAKKLIKTWYNC